MSIRPSKQACVQQVRPCKPSVALRSPRTSYSIARGSICHERSCESAASSEMSVGADLEATDDAGVVGPERDEPSAIVFQLCFIRRVPLITGISFRPFAETNSFVVRAKKWPPLRPETSNRVFGVHHDLLLAGQEIE